jgi:DtxR family Mn-dependent transcriptional regulator
MTKTIRQQETKSSVAIEDYLKAILRLTEEGGRANTTVLAKQLKVEPAAVSQMMKILADRGWVEYKPYYGAILTEEGKIIAEEMVRHHRLLERYLCDHLGYSPEEAHHEAERLEHHISEEFEARIARLMNEPSTCPHGQPIPPKQTKN